jgi:cell division protein FtsN
MDKPSEIESPPDSPPDQKETAGFGLLEGPPTKPELTPSPPQAKEPTTPEGPSKIIAKPRQRWDRTLKQMVPAEESKDAKKTPGQDNESQGAVSQGPQLVKAQGQPPGSPKKTEKPVGPPTAKEQVETKPTKQQTQEKTSPQGPSRPSKVETKPPKQKEPKKAESQGPQVVKAKPQKPRPSSTQKKDVAALPKQKPKKTPKPSAEKPKPPRAKPATRGYIVRLGSFRIKKNADELYNEMKKRGYNVVMAVYHHKTLGKLHTVQLPPVGKASEARAIMTEVKSKEKINAFIVREPVR